MIERDLCEANPRRSKPASSPLAVLLHAGLAEVRWSTRPRGPLRVAPFMGRRLARHPCASRTRAGSIRSIRYWRLRLVSGIRFVMQ
jgi:hypothetical protein